MSSIKPFYMIVLLAIVTTLTGCADKKNEKAVFSQDNKHSSDWIKTHVHYIFDKNDLSAITANKYEFTLGDIKSIKSRIASCTECHGENYDGGISKVSCMSAAAVSGFRCHATSPADNPTGCVSCHGGMPYGPFGNTAPNRGFAHTKCTIVSDCWTCHKDAGYSTSEHARATPSGDIRPATVLMSDNVKAKKIISSFSYDPTSGKCFGTSCHGGQPSTPWNEPINLAGDNACFQCHEQGVAPTINDASPTPQYNSFYSGRFSGSDPVTNLHQAHLKRQNKYCTNCHNINIQSDFKKHFGGIAVNNESATAADKFTDPGATIGGKPTNIGSYNKDTKTCFAVDSGVCHPSSWHVNNKGVSWDN